MPVYRLPPQFVFPPADHAEPNGLLAVGGDLSPGRVWRAYQHGIFPWFSEGQPILWWSPDPRMVLRVDALRVQRSLRKRIRQQPYRITMDRAFADVIAACATAPREGQEGTWITEEMMATYNELHRRGVAHSVEAWDGEQLVGGLYGIAVGRIFCGESMFARASDASKIAFTYLVRQLEAWSCPLVDCQMHTPHLARFGAVEIPRAEFMRQLVAHGPVPMRIGPWRFDIEVP
jgi:leucyl/phenylalanyl-tRNA--protein transferase